jgi:hypothetical protein
MMGQQTRTESLFTTSVWKTGFPKTTCSESLISRSI